MNKGALCISLDFEKFWGMHDVTNLKTSEPILLEVSQTVLRLLDLFDKYEIHCTWAIVGMLNFETNSEIMDFCRIFKSPYTNKNYSPFPLSKFDLEKVNVSTYLGQNDISKIADYKNQEIASHTFSHYYCLETGQSIEDFQNDVLLFKKLFENEVKSIVFPRNQVSSEYLKICSNNGMTSYRGNQENKFWSNASYKSESTFKKIGRTLDAYVKLSEDNLISWGDMGTKSNGMINIPASRFLRPYRLPRPIETLKINRIKKQMLKAAEQNKVYHLWWHPHNFSSNSDANFNQLEDILKYYKGLNHKFSFESLNMSEISQKVG